MLRTVANRPSLSVLLCVYRPDRKYYRQAVASILNQSFSDFELIIVEDPSELSGREMIADLMDQRVRYHVNAKRTCFADQKNKGLHLARGEFIAMFDADDIAEPHRLERQVTFLRSERAIGLVGSQIRVIDADGNHFGYRRFPTEHNAILRSMERIVPVCHPSIMARRETFLDIGGYQCDNHPAEDYELWSRLAQNNVQFANLHEPLLRYRIHGSQIKAMQVKRTIRAVLNVKKKYWRDGMTLRGRGRMIAERLLLYMPSKWVYRLMLRMLFRDELSETDSEQQPIDEVHELTLESVGAPELSWQPYHIDNVIVTR